MDEKKPKRDEEKERRRDEAGPSVNRENASRDDDDDDDDECCTVGEAVEEQTRSTQVSYVHLAADSDDSIRPGTAQTEVPSEHLYDVIIETLVPPNIAHHHESQQEAMQDTESACLVRPPPQPEETQTDEMPGEIVNLELRSSEVELLQRLHQESLQRSRDFKKISKSLKSKKTRLTTRRTVSTNIGYSQYRRDGEAFLDLEFMSEDENDDKDKDKTVKSHVSKRDASVEYIDSTYDDEEGEEEGEKEKWKKDEDEDAKTIHTKIVSNAQEIKTMVSDKKLGLPQFHSESILEMADRIIVHHSDSIYDIFGDPPPESSIDTLGNDKTDHYAQNIKDIAAQSEGILDVLKTKSGNRPGSNDNNSAPLSREAAVHLEKMVRRLHCRHRKMKNLAEEIIAKRWKLMNMESVNARRHKGEEVATDYRRRKKNHKRQDKRKGRPLSDKEMKALSSNPMAPLKSAGKECNIGENWKDDDPLWKAIHKVGVEKFDQCVYKREPEIKAKKTVAKTLPPKIGQSMWKESNIGVFPSGKPNVEALFQGKSAVTIFFSNYSRMVVTPTTMEPLTGKTKTNMVSLSVDKNELSNDFVEQWKRRSYAVGIFLIILTALLHCSYLTGPRMGDNYATYTMTQSIAGPTLLFAPFGIYGIIFLGYLFGGMAVIKTASATEHNQTVKEYFTQRRKKFFLWYGLAIFFLIVGFVRCGMWYSALENTEHEIRNIFHSKFYYYQLPSRLLYTQFLLGCCGANGPDDYEEKDKIGLPKSCYVRVYKYDDYFRDPMPSTTGCLATVYKYSALAMSVICSLSLIVWLLALIHPIYLYVYELFICMRSHVPEPWLEYTKD